MNAVSPAEQEQHESRGWHALQCLWRQGDITDSEYETIARRFKAKYWQHKEREPAK